MYTINNFLTQWILRYQNKPRLYYYFKSMIMKWYDVFTTIMDTTLCHVNLTRYFLQHQFLEFLESFFKQNREDVIIETIHQTLRDQDRPFEGAVHDHVTEVTWPLVDRAEIMQVRPRGKIVLLLRSEWELVRLKTGTLVIDIPDQPISINHLLENWTVGLEQHYILLSLSQNSQFLIYLSWYFSSIFAAVAAGSNILELIISCGLTKKIFLHSIQYDRKFALFYMSLSYSFKNHLKKIYALLQQKRAQLK